MKTMRHTMRLVLGIVLGCAVLAAAFAAVATAQRPQGMSPAEYRALMIRSHYLNERYQVKGPAPETVRADRLRGEYLNERYGNVSTRMTPTQFRGMYERGVWLNQHARTLWPASTPTVPRVVTVGDGFDWGDAAVGAGFVAGVALLGTGAAVAVRRHEHGHAVHPAH